MTYDMVIMNYKYEGKLERRDHSEDLGVHRKIILKWTLDKEGGKMWTEFIWLRICSKSRGSSVGIALGYGLDDWGSRVRFPAGAGNFSLHHRVQDGSGAHPASYPIGARDSFPGAKAVGTLS
jgi:hypothetical protein